MDNTKKEDLMDKYASGTLSQAELKELEKMLNSNPSFQNELNMRKNISDSVNIVGNRDLRKMLNKLHGEVVEKKTKARGKGKLIKMAMSLAAILLIGLVIYQLGFFNSGSTDIGTQKIQYASYYEPELSSSRSSDEIQDDNLTSISEAYSTADYQKVISLSGPFLNGSNDEVKLVAAIAYLETGNATEAMGILAKLLSTENYYYKDHANWYKALAYLQLDDTESAKKLLINLSNDTKADHYLEAKELLKGM